MALKVNGRVKQSGVRNDSGRIISPEEEAQMLTVCDREAIHLIGTIQEYGYLVCVRLPELQVNDSGMAEELNYDPAQSTIIAFSDNLLQPNDLLLNDSIIDHDQLLHKSIASVFSEEVGGLFMELIRRFEADSQQGSKDPRQNLRNVSHLRLSCRGSIPIPNNNSNSNSSNRIGSDNTIRSSSSSSSCGDICDRQQQRHLICSVVSTLTEDRSFHIEVESVLDAQLPKLPHPHIPESTATRIAERVNKLCLLSTPAEIVSYCCDAFMEDIPGYDRGMVYCFHEDMHGEVIHEKIPPQSREKVGASFLHMHFPAMDIPKPARDLFMKNLVRSIDNIDGVEASVVGEPGMSPADLTMSSMRGVSKMHVQYLRNMKVVATVACAIIVDGRLWGLVVLHSYTAAVHPTFDQRMIMETLCSLGGHLIGPMEREKLQDEEFKMKEVALSFTGLEDISEVLKEQSDRLLSLLKIDALEVVVTKVGDCDEASYTICGDRGILPTTAGRTMLENRSAPGVIIADTRMSEFLSGDGAGALFYKQPSASICAVRRKQIKDLRWAGNPDNKTIDSVTGMLTPRSSFEQYLEHAEQSPYYWSETDMKLAKTLFNAILSHVAVQKLTSAKYAKQFDFFARMAHELRTPFHGVMSTLEVLSTADAKKQPILPDERASMLLSALDCGYDMLKILDNVLALAKAKSGADADHGLPRMVPAITFANHVKNMMSPLATNKKVRLRVSPTVQYGEGSGMQLYHNSNSSGNNSGGGVDGAEVKAVELLDSASVVNIIIDADRMMHVCANLVGNAIKFTAGYNAGPRTVSVESHVITSDEAVQALWLRRCSQYQGSYSPCGQGPIDVRSGSSSSNNNSGNSIGSNSDHSNHGGLSKGGSSNNSLAALANTSSAPSSSSSSVWFVFEVQDTGPGVSPEQMHGMFEAFHQLATEGTRVYQGTGLGLHICQSNIVDMHGFIGIASHLRAGALFFCAVPVMVMISVRPVGTAVLTNTAAASCSSGDLMLRSSGSDSETSTTLNGSNGSTVSFMLVDDSPVNIRMTARKLRMSLGSELTIHTASDGAKAVELYLALLESHQIPNGIFMDNNMPICSGPEAIKRIREIEFNRKVLQRVHIVSYSADVSEFAERAIREVGADEVLPKPTPAGMLENVAKRLSKQRRL